MKPCPRKTSTHCLLWGASAITIIVFLAVFSIIGRMEDWSLFKEVVVATGATFGIMWCIWVIHAFRSIISWWIYMQDQITTVSTLLSEAKKDLKELKSIKQGK
jgi:hypothetical protein